MLIFDGDGGGGFCEQRFVESHCDRESCEAHMCTLCDITHTAKRNSQTERNANAGTIGTSFVTNYETLT